MLWIMPGFFLASDTSVACLNLRILHFVLKAISASICLRVTTYVFYIWNNLKSCNDFNYLMVHFWETRMQQELQEELKKYTRPSSWTSHCTDGKTDSKEINKEASQFSGDGKGCIETKTEAVQTGRNAWGWVENLRAEWCRCWYFAPRYPASITVLIFLP